MTFRALAVETTSSVPRSMSRFPLGIVASFDLLKSSVT